MLFLYLTIVLIGIALFTLFAVYAERKVSAFIQDRLGPMETGPYGVVQTFADVLKLLQKELIIPDLADKWLFRFAPLLVFAVVVISLATIPVAKGVAGINLPSALFLLLAVGGLDIIGVLMAGWGSNNKYALLGAARSVAQIVSYEIPAALALLVAVVMYGTLSLDEIAALQGIHAGTPVRLLGVWDVSQVGGIASWGVVLYPHLLIAAILYFIAGMAEANRAPFDLPEAESELVSGFHTEYSGVRFALFMLAEYGKMLLISLLAATVFFGGWNTPLPNLGPVRLADWTTGTEGSVIAVCWGTFWLLFKGLALVIFQMWMRWTYPRLRVDQLMALCWKYLTPFSFALLIISAVWKTAS